MIIGRILALIVNFSAMQHGGAHGEAGALYWPMKVKDLPHFRQKPIILRPQKGRPRGALSTPVERFLAKKTRFFTYEAFLSRDQRRPPHPPPHAMHYQILKYNVSTLTGIKNHLFWTNTHVCMCRNAPPSHFQPFWASESSRGGSKILPKYQKSMIFGYFVQCDL